MVGFWLLFVSGYAASSGRAAELEANDFKFDGEIGCPGAKIEKVGANEFRIIVPSSPGSKDLTPDPNGPPFVNEGKELWPSRMQFIITGHAKGNKLKLTKYYQGKVFDKEPGITASAVWSYDKKNWTRIAWREGVMEFPAFEQDRVYLYASPLPMTNEDIAELVREWQKSPYVKVHVVGQSLQKKLDMCRIEVTDPNSPTPGQGKWVHYLANQHGHENHARWVLAGMVDWLIGPDGMEARRNSVFHIVVAMNPDGIANGYIRPNTQGIDTNRSYFPRGSDKAKQAHEAYLFQKDLEGIMASNAPAISIWSMHNGGGTVINPGRECGTVLEPAEKLAEAIRRNDPNNFLMTNWPIAQRRGGGNTTWNGGPAFQFPGVTDTLYEGSPAGTKAEKMRGGAALAKAIVEYWRGTKPAVLPPPPSARPASRPASQPALRGAASKPNR